VLARKQDPNAPYITAREASRRLGVHYNTIMRVLVAGGVRKRVLPATKPRWSAEDVEALKRASVQGSGPEGRAAG
jgi:predicted site-specific integrase-resolvase